MPSGAHKHVLKVHLDAVDGRDHDGCRTGCHSETHELRDA